MSAAARYVREFHDTYGCPSRETPALDVPEAPMRLALILEEVQELTEALDAGDLIETADALGDLAYVIYGAALTFGIDLDAVLAEVHRSNMSKLGLDGRPMYREDGKVLKGPNFTPPNIRAALDGVRAGADPEPLASWVECTCGHDIDGHGATGCFPECGCQDPGPAPTGGMKDYEVYRSAFDKLWVFRCLTCCDQIDFADWELAVYHAHAHAQKHEDAECPACGYGPYIREDWA